LPSQERTPAAPLLALACVCSRKAMISNECHYITCKPCRKLFHPCVPRILRNLELRCARWWVWGLWWWQVRMSSDDAETVCPISAEALREGEWAARMPCGHYFGKDDLFEVSASPASASASCSAAFASTAVLHCCGETVESERFSLTCRTSACHLHACAVMFALSLSRFAPVTLPPAPTERFPVAALGWSAPASLSGCV